MTAGGDTPQGWEEVCCFVPLSWGTAFPREKHFSCSLNLSSVVAGLV